MSYAKRLEWAGHIWRADRKIIKKKKKNVTIRSLSRKRPPGSPNQRWLDRVVKDIRVIDKFKRLEESKDWRRMEKFGLSC